MSGNKTSILELYHPKVEINLEYKRELKATLLSKSTSFQFSWYSWFPTASLVMSAFVVFASVWHFFGSNEPKKNNSTSIDTVSQNTSRVGSESTPASSVFSIESSPVSQETQEEKNVNLPQLEVHPPTQSAKSTKTLQPPIEDANKNELDITSDIANISNEIDTLASTSSETAKGLEKVGVAGAQDSLLVMKNSIAPIPESSNTVAINYSDRMFIYSKPLPWTREELREKSGATIVATKMKTIAKDIIETKILTLVGVIETSIEYQIAEKSGDSLYYLVPTLRYQTQEGKTGNIILVTGFTQKD